MSRIFKSLPASLFLGLALVGTSAIAWAQAAPGNDANAAANDAAEVDYAGPHAKGKRGKRGNRGVPLCMPKAFLDKMTPYDVDQNGYLDPDEHKAMRQAKRAERLARYDQDGDGRLSKDERTPIRHDRRVERFESLDENRDGSISKAEAETSCTPLAWHFDKVDGDGNGIVEWTEFEAAALKREQHMSNQRGKRGKRGMRGMRGGRW